MKLPQRIEDHEYDPELHDIGTPAYDELRRGFVWNVSYGDEQRIAGIRAITEGPLEGVIVEGTDRATRPKKDEEERLTPKKMPATVIRPEARVRHAARRRTKP